MLDWLYRYIWRPVQLVGWLQTSFNILGWCGFWAFINHYQATMSPELSGVYVIGTAILSLAGMACFQLWLSRQKAKEKERRKVQKSLVAGEIIAGAGKMFVAGKEAMNKAYDAKTITPEAYKKWADFGKWFQAIYPTLVQIWKDEVKKRHKLD